MSIPAVAPYPPTERHGVVGDRRIAALVGADGALNWLCLSNYDDASRRCGRGWWAAWR